MSAAAVILPFVWAIGNEQAGIRNSDEVPRKPIEPQMAFYRKYTEAIAATVCAHVHGGRKSAVVTGPGDVSRACNKLSG